MLPVPGLQTRPWGLQHTGQTWVACSQAAEHTNGLLGLSGKLECRDEAACILLKAAEAGGVIPAQAEAKSRPSGDGLPEDA